MTLTGNKIIRSADVEVLAQHYNAIVDNGSIHVVDLKSINNSLKRIIEDNLNPLHPLEKNSLIIPEKHIEKIEGSLLPKDQTVFKGRVERSVKQMYDEDDLSLCSLFGGGFINFGYWNSIEQEITIDQRIQSQKNMYRHVLSTLCISEKDRVLEVGSGLGVGGALAMTEFKPKEIIGIDFAKAQVARANRINKDLVQTGKLSYQIGVAEIIPFENHCFDKVYSVEAAQHFESLEKFISESYRVIIPQGKIAVAAFFGTSENSLSQVSKMVQTVRDGIDRLPPIADVKKMFLKAGYINLKIESLGERVWEGYDKWVSQGDLKDSWTRNWLKSYQQNLIDYYLITAEKV